jgi:hypothetical protein
MNISMFECEVDVATVTASVIDSHALSLVRVLWMRFSVDTGYDPVTVSDQSRVGIYVLEFPLEKPSSIGLLDLV